MKYFWLPPPIGTQNHLTSPLALNSQNVLLVYVTLIILKTNSADNQIIVYVWTRESDILE